MCLENIKICDSGFLRYLKMILSPGQSLCSEILRWSICCRYEPLFNYFLEFSDAAFRVVADNYVTDDSGTGIVHCAPAFGEDDYRVCIGNQIINKVFPKYFLKIYFSLSIMFYYPWYLWCIGSVTCWFFYFFLFFHLVLMP